MDPVAEAESVLRGLKTARRANLGTHWRGLKKLQLRMLRRGPNIYARDAFRLGANCAICASFPWFSGESLSFSEPISRVYILRHPGTFRPRPLHLRRE